MPDAPFHEAGRGDKDRTARRGEYFVPGMEVDQRGGEQSLHHEAETGVNAEVLEGFWQQRGQQFEKQRHSRDRVRVGDDGPLRIPEEQRFAEGKGPGGIPVKHPAALVGCDIFAVKPVDHPVDPGDPQRFQPVDAEKYHDPKEGRSDQMPMLPQFFHGCRSCLRE